MIAEILFNWMTLVWIGAGIVLVGGYFFLKRLVIELAVTFGDSGESASGEAGGDGAAAGGDGGGGD